MPPEHCKVPREQHSILQGERQAARPAGQVSPGRLPGSQADLKDRLRLHVPGNHGLERAGEAPPESPERSSVQESEGVLRQGTDAPRSEHGVANRLRDHERQLSAAFFLYEQEDASQQAAVAELQESASQLASVEGWAGSPAAWPGPAAEHPGEVDPESDGQARAVRFSEQASHAAEGQKHRRQEQL